MWAKSHINPYHYLLLFHYLTVQEPFYYQTDDILEKNDSLMFKITGFINGDSNQ